MRATLMILALAVACGDDTYFVTNEAPGRDGGDQTGDGDSARDAAVDSERDSGATVERDAGADAGGEVDSGPEQCSDVDGDGACDSVDACPQDAADDSDGDGSCDSADLCAGEDDRFDHDSDGTPDGCDKCSGSDVDADHNGFADACDQLLWSFARSSGSDFDAVSVLLRLKRGDGAWVQLSLPVSGASLDMSTPPAEPTVTVEEAPGAFSDVVNALTIDFDGLPFNGERTEAHVLLHLAGGGEALFSGSKQTTLDVDDVVTRLSVVGHVDESGADVEWQVYGYTP